MAANTIHTPTISTAVESFLIEVERLTKRAGHQSVESALEMFCDFLNENAPETLPLGEQIILEKSGQEYCDMIGPSWMLSSFDRFFRYRMLRELVTEAPMRELVQRVVFDFCGWLSLNNLLTKADTDKVTNLKQHFKALDDTTARLAKELARHSYPMKDKRYIEKIGFGRHDVVRIDGSDIWLEIWSLPELMATKKIGPIAIPNTTASLLEIGWMIASELGKTKNGDWQFIDVGAVYPSLPF